MQLAAGVFLSIDSRTKLQVVRKTQLRTRSPCQINFHNPISNALVIDLYRRKHLLRILNLAPSSVPYLC